MNKCRWTMVALVASAAMVALTGCGGSGGPTSAGSPAAASSTLAKQVPAAIAKDGVLSFGSDMTYPPFESLDASKQPVGFDIDLARAIAGTLGLQARFVQNGFDALPTGLDAGRFELVISAMTDNAERRQAMSFVDYVQVRGGVMVRTGDKAAPSSFDELCGRTVAVQRGSDQVQQAQAKSTACTKVGKQPLSIKVFPSAPDQALALSSNRVDAALYDTVTGGYTASKSQGKFTMAQPYGTPSIDAIGVPKNDPALAEVVQKALQTLMDNGTYDQLLQKWGMTQAKYPTATINAG